MTATPSLPAALFLVITTLLAGNFAGPAFASELLSVSDVAKRASSGAILLIDIRTPGEWRKTGIPAPAFTNNVYDKNFIERLNTRLDGNKDAPIALICARGNRSTRLSDALEELGYTNVFNVSEGMLGSKAGPGWLASGLPVVNSPSE